VRSQPVDGDCSLRQLVTCTNCAKPKEESDLVELFRFMVSSHPKHPDPRDTTPPPWLARLVDSLTSQPVTSQPGEPRYEGSSKVVPLHKRNAATAAWHLAEPGVVDRDPKALRRYLRDWLGMREYQITPNHEATLWELITEEMEREPSRSRRKDPWKTWLSDPQATECYLRGAIPKRIALNDRPRRGATKSANLKKLYEQNYKRPSYLEDFPGGKEGVKLLERWTPEGVERFLEDLRGILTSRQYQVIERLVRGKSPKEIAQELRISVSAVSERKTRALSREGFREVIKRHL
jgi:Bacterial regulatory proteins, luxR family